MRRRWIKEENLRQQVELLLLCPFHTGSPLLIKPPIYKTDSFLIIWVCREQRQRFSSSISFFPCATATLVSSRCDAYKYCVIRVTEDLIWALTNENLREGVSKGSYCVETTRRFWVNTQNKRATLRHLIDLHALPWRSDHPARATLIFHSKRVASNYRRNRIV
jgi:hypothetical protein